MMSALFLAESIDLLVILLLYDTADIGLLVILLILARNL